MKSKTLRNLIIGGLTVQLISFNFYIPVFAEEDISGQMAFAQCEEYINVRENADIDSAVIGKIYNNGAVTILDEQEGWYHIHSGNVEGYVSVEYFATGAEADSIAEETAYNVATVYPEALTVRAAASEDSEAIGTVYANDEIDVISYDGDWMYVWVDGIVGYISAYYVDYNTYYPVAETLDEEQYRLDQEWQEYLDAQRVESTAPADYVAPDETYDWWYQSDGYYEDYEDNTTDDYVWDDELGEYVYDASDAEYVEDTSDTYDDYVEESYDNISDETYYDADTGEYVTPTSGGGQFLVDCAIQYVGNPYVWGGTSLTNGTDCSGFTQSVLAANGIYIPRTAAEQAVSGTQVSLDDIQAGDLLFYDSGNGIDHVSMYMGNGQVVHASNPNAGITISDYSYRTPVSASRYW